ncbi:MAG TPA: TetR/AcrR family transcriptional regulator, partial [Alphaproteobacteria bacterium]|nr:TetR/AcrR family transcriptional regulator [Alphaproteobacteria bacterium]
RDTLRQSIEQFARDLLGTLAGEVSVTLNRLAVAHAGEEKPDLGTIVLENGRLEMGRRLKPVLEAGRDARLLRFDSSEEAFRTFFGLVVRDVQIRLLLGDTLELSAADIDRDARRATEQFLQLYERR